MYNVQVLYINCAKVTRHDLSQGHEARLVFVTAAAMRGSCMGARRGFIVRMKIGNVPVDPMTATHTVRARHRNTLGPSSDGNQYAVVHVTGYIKNWPPSGQR